MSGVNRRDFIKTGVAGLAATAAGVSPRLTDAATPASYPAIDIAPLDSLAPGAEVAFEYPDPNAPSLLMRLKSPAAGGVGPDGDIVAFSMLCTHKGCPLNSLADRQMLVCPCHWSSFDPAKGGRLVIGQASQALPQIRLEVRDGMVRAVGMDGLIYGRHTNIL
ncbi:MAG: arsenate reductase (azurin) small subunit [Rhodospirillaceae bacterium]